MEDLVVSDMHEVGRIFSRELGLIPNARLVAFTGKFGGVDALFEHDMFATGSAVIFCWDNETGKFMIYDRLAGSHNSFILYPQDCRHRKYAKSVVEMKQTVDRIKEELKNYAVCYNNMEVADALSVLE